MADSAISALSAASTLDATEIYPASQSSASKGVTGAQIQTMVRRAGSASAGSWPIFGSGTVLTSEVAGAEEFDGTCEYFGLGASQRSVALAEYFICLSGTYTLGNNANVQKAFDGGTSNGALTLPTGLYFFEALLSISSMSSTSGNAAFDVKGGGGATLGDVLYMIIGIDGVTASVAATSGSTSNASQSIAAPVAVNVNTNLQLSIRGMFRVTGQGSIIPSVKLANGAAAVVAVGSFFRCRCMGSSSVTTCGQWS